VSHQRSAQPAWEIVQIARHEARPYALDFITRLSPGFVELCGDRLSGDDRALVAGVGRWLGRTAFFLGQQKGRTFAERVQRNFGMMHPEGYRKALRIARQAAKFGRPLISLVDTPGAYPGVEAEERGIATAIATTILEFFRLRTPIVAVVIGEGGSGGALGLAIADRVLMLENAVMSVASPEACASILWRDASFKVEAAEQLGMTAPDLYEMGLVDDVVPEPPGGAHTDYDAAAEALDRCLRSHMNALTRLGTDELLERRYRRFRQVGAELDWQEAPWRAS
jgi:acetyl-CoA carboxylase carboxyl transferase subunit alpha